MGFQVWQKGLCVLCFSLIFICGVIGEETTIVKIEENPVAQTDENYVCATLDLWPPTKCNYGNCPWGKSSFLNLDLNNNIIRNAVKEFAPLKLRFGGTLQDRLVYQTSRDEPCDSTFYNNTNLILDFSHACLSLDRWDEINQFILETGSEAVFGLNALRGKTVEIKGIIKDGQYLGETTTAVGEWDYSNSKFLIEYSVKKGYKHIRGWTLGNELGGRTLFIGVSPEDCANDAKKLHELVKEIYQDQGTMPLIIAPGAIFDLEWYTEFIDRSPELHVATHHMYNLGSGGDDALKDVLLTASFFDEETKSMFEGLQKIVDRPGTKAVAWIGEAGGAFNSGQDGISNTFINGFWYLNMLGYSALLDTKTFCRQTLTGGNYGLLQTGTYIPNPDYYSALLWHRLMGSKVLKTEIVGTKNVYIYAHCAKKSNGITILVLNHDGESSVKISLDPSKYGSKREEYHLTPVNNNLQSRLVKLNGELLHLDPSGVIPALNPVEKDNSKQLEVAPYSFMFVHLPGPTKFSACEKPAGK
uniref:Beta-glucuronidase n=1 Tax=Scutellaria baicalensis TaxID=65409 RepID=A0A0P0A360_SCUBA|nr:beta-glucuronidase [Scutellaria baicalensis]